MCYKDKQISVSLDNDDTYTAEMEFMTAHDTNVKNQGDPNYYSSHPDVPSTFSYAEAICPQTQTIGDVKKSFSFIMSENAVGILRLKRK